MNDEQSLHKFNSIELRCFNYAGEGDMPARILTGPESFAPFPMIRKALFSSVAASGYIPSSQLDESTLPAA